MITLVEVPRTTVVLLSNQYALSVCHMSLYCAIEKTFTAFCADKDQNVAYLQCTNFNSENTIRFCIGSLLEYVENSFFTLCLVLMRQMFCKYVNFQRIYPFILQFF